MGGKKRTCVFIVKGHMTVTKEQTKAAFQMVAAIAETIREVKEVPSGVLYAGLMGKMDIEGFSKIVGVLERAKLVELTPSHVLRWIGPALNQ